MCYLNFNNVLSIFRELGLGINFDKVVGYIIIVYLQVSF